MPRIDVTVSVEIPSSATLTEIEARVLQSVLGASRALVVRSLQTLDARAVAASGGVVQRTNPRFVLTRFGEIRFERTKVLSGGRYLHPPRCAASAHRSVA